jgi:membrane protease YdiL (CAAX protease family)
MSDTTPPQQEHPEASASSTQREQSAANSCADSPDALTDASKASVWPALIVAAAAIALQIFASAVAIVAAVVWDGDITILQDGEALGNWLEGFVSTSAGLVLLVLPGQLTFLAAALVAARLARAKTVDCLGLRHGRLPFWTWPVFFLATPVVAMLSSIVLVHVVKEPSEQMKMLERLFSQHARETLPLLLLLVSVLPGIAEETLFRGFVQRRLLLRLPAFAAIGISAVFFAGAHMDPMHTIGVLPLGLWLGFVAWRADSIWPAIFGHVGNNVFAIGMSLVDLNEIDSGTSAAVAASAGVCFLAFIVCLVILARYRPAPVDVHVDDDTGVVFVDETSDH